MYCSCREINNTLRLKKQDDHLRKRGPDIISHSAAWELIGHFVIVLYVVEASNFAQFSLMQLILMDLYFLVDVIFRLNRHTHSFEKKQFMQLWLIFDIMLTIPYGCIFHLFFNRPAVKLVQGKRPILQFVINDDFRKDVWKNIRMHFTEREILQRIWIMPQNKSHHTWQYLAHRTYRFLGFGFRIVRKLRLLSYYSAAARILSRVFVSARTLSRILWSLAFSNRNAHSPN